MRPQRPRSPPEQVLGTKTRPNKTRCDFVLRVAHEGFADAALAIDGARRAMPAPWLRRRRAAIRCAHGMDDPNPETNSTRACWATFEPKQGPTAWDRKGDPIGPIVLFLCVPPSVEVRWNARSDLSRAAPSDPRSTMIFSDLGRGEKEY